jgi:hypothetical protein
VALGDGKTRKFIVEFSGKRSAQNQAGIPNFGMPAVVPR